MKRNFWVPISSLLQEILSQSVTTGKFSICVDSYDSMTSPLACLPYVDTVPEHEEIV